MLDCLPIMVYNDCKLSCDGRKYMFVKVKDMAQKWGISERSVRDYCAKGKIEGAELKGKTWFIPESALCPKDYVQSELLKVLRAQKESKLSGGVYHKVQVELTYNSNRIEGSKLSEDQTRYIFETNTIGLANGSVNVDDIIETSNHFKCIDYIIDNAEKPITENMIKYLHKILKTGTSDSRKDWFVVGGYKKLPNEVGGNQTVAPENVKGEMQRLLNKYNSLDSKTLEDIIVFHKEFESVHPFQDGNGRIGRLLMFKECLANNIVPFIISDDLKLFYYRGLKEWDNQKGYLIDTCLTAQDRFKRYLDYYRINYND